MDPQLKKIRERLLYEFPFYSKSALKIRTKSGDIAPLALNPAQEILQKAVDKQQKTDGQEKKFSLESELNFILNAYFRVFCYLFTISADVRRNKAKIGYSM